MNNLEKYKNKNNNNTEKFKNKKSKLFNHK